MRSAQLTLLHGARCRASTRAMGTGPRLALRRPFWTRSLRWPRERQVEGPGAATQPWVPAELRGGLRHPQGNGFAFGSSALGQKVLRGRRTCSAIAGSVTPFPLLLNSSIFFSACNCLALTSSHWISLRELVWVGGVSRGNTGDHKSFLLIYKHQSLLI